eukprot:TRINITY_DN8093_c0_g1_i1.p1 TRINITY_DN8093_c0_g1~~TRINITY_DN8093_c0_g1_i1.p1  ORF type:complete len:100 (-),score=24.95 TRINITY_DN8093_c0_g1_i1:35-334(-)
MGKILIISTMESKLQKSQVDFEDEEFAKKHASVLYKTTASQVGAKQVIILPEKGKGINGKFTDHLLHSGMYRNQGLNTKVDRDRSVSYTHLTLPTIYSV